MPACVGTHQSTVGQGASGVNAVCLAVDDAAALACAISDAQTTMDMAKAGPITYGAGSTVHGMLVQTKS